MTKYEVIIYWSKEDEAYVAEVLNLPGAPLTVTHRRMPCATLKRRLACGLRPRRNLAIPSRSQSAGVWFLRERLW